MRYYTSNLLRILSFSAIIFSVSSCSNDMDREEFSAALQGSFTTKDATSKKSTRNIATDVYSVYRDNSFAPVWLNDEGKVKNAEAFIKELRALNDEGIDTTRFQIATLNSQLEEISKRKGKKDVAAVAAWDKQMTAAYIQAASTLLYGVLDPEDAVDMWYHDNDSTVNFAENIKDNSFPSLDAYRSKLSTYKALVEYRKNTQSDSIKDAVDANLERLRWLPKSFEENHVLVIVPMMEMMLNEGSKTTVQMKAVMGRTDRETPSLNADMVNIVFNPSWGVPPGIMKKDVIPGLLNKGTGYLDKKGLKVYDRQGNEVDPSKITADNYKGYVFRQPPSERNALGQIKFNMPNPWDIYLHDTPSKDDFNKDERYKSSGCVRLERAYDLATHILKKMNSNNDSLDLDQLIAKGETKFVKLQKPIPVHIVYLTAYEINGQLQFFKDAYNKDKSLAASLKEAK